jgi:hypothetical protein
MTTNVFDLCEICGKPEKGHSAKGINRKLSTVQKGPARYQVNSIMCSRCVQRLINSTKHPEPTGENTRRNSKMAP